MEQVIFSSKEELYNRVLPALRCKKKSLYHDGFKNIKEIDIWNYLRNMKWDNSIGLELCDMIDDILNTENVSILKYFHNKYMLKEEKYEKIDLPKLRD